VRDHPHRAGSTLSGILRLDAKARLRTVLDTYQRVGRNVANLLNRHEGFRNEPKHQT
jgi:hypothetical protein